MRKCIRLKQREWGEKRSDEKKKTVWCFCFPSKLCVEHAFVYVSVYYAIVAVYTVKAVTAAAAARSVEMFGIISLRDDIRTPIHTCIYCSCYKVRYPPVSSDRHRHRLRVFLGFVRRSFTFVWVNRVECLCPVQYRFSANPLDSF